MDDKIDTYDQILGQCALSHVHPSWLVPDKVPYNPKVPNNQTRLPEKTLRNGLQVIMKMRSEWS